MLKIKRTMIALFSLVVTTSLLVSCTKTNQQVSLDKNGNNIPTKPLELTVWNTQGTDYVFKNVDENVVEDWLYDKTKVRVKNIYGNDGGQWDSKLTKLVAGNNLPDIVWCQAGQGATHFNRLNELGKVWQLTPEIIQKYAPEVWKRTPEKFWDKLSVDGKILGIPFNFDSSKLEEVSPNLTEDEISTIRNHKVTLTSDVMAQSAGGLWIRDDILKMIFPRAKSYDELVALLAEKGKPIGDELLDIPIYTTEEYIKFMYDIQKLGLAEDGKKVYTYGYAGDGNDNWEALCNLGSDMYGYKGNFYTSMWNNVKNEIEIPLVGDLVKQAAKTQNEMINDGVIDPESLAHIISQFKTKVYNGQYAICDFSRLGNTLLSNQQLENSGKKFKYRPFVTQVPAKKGYEANISTSSFGDSLCLSKTLSEEDVIQILTWINLQYTSEYDEVLYWGPKEAGLYTETADGKRKFVDDRFTKYFVENDTSALKVNETKGLGAAANRLTVRPMKYCKWTPDILLKYEKYTPTLNSGFKFPTTSPHVANIKIYPPCQAWSAEYAQVKEVSIYWSAREQWEGEFKKAFVAPKTEFDIKWSAAIEELNSIVNVDEMAKKMTEIARPLAEEIKRNNK